MEIPLSEYIKKTIEEIKNGLPSGYTVEGPIDFEVSLTTSTNKSGGLEIKIVSGEIEKGKESVQTAYFSVINEDQKEKSEKKSADTIVKYAKKALKVLSEYSDNNQQQNVENNNGKQYIGG